MKEPTEEDLLLAIDEDNLGRECNRLPRQFHRAALALANTKRDLSEAQSALSVVEAELALLIRQKPERYGLDKVTESSIKELMAINPKVTNLEKVIRGLEHNRDVEQALVTALDVKKRMLVAEVELHGMNYYSEPKPSERGREALDKISRKKAFPSVARKNGRDRERDE